MIAKIKIGNQIYVIELNPTASGPRFLVSTEGEPENPPFLQSLQRFANRKHDELRFQYIPHEPLAIAELMAQKIGGKVIWWNRSTSTEPLPEGIVL